MQTKTNTNIALGNLIIHSVITSKILLLADTQNCLELLAKMIQSIEVSLNDLDPQTTFPAFRGNEIQTLYINLNKITTNDSDLLAIISYFKGLIEQIPWFQKKAVA